MTLINDAIRLAELGYRVFPLKPGSKQPLPGSHGCSEATTDEDQIAEWWEKNPDANLAISTDGLVVVDIDQDGDIDHPWVSSESDRYFDLIGGASSITPRGGYHLFHRMPPNVDIRNSASKVAKGVDIRANGGYVVVPPSFVDDGKSKGRYLWNVALELEVPPDELPLPPQWLLDLIFGDVKEDGESEGISEVGDILESGHRNQTLIRFAGGFRRYGLSQPEIEGALFRINSIRCKPPLDVDEVKEIAHSACRYEPDQSLVFAVNGAGVDNRDSVNSDDTLTDPGPLPEEYLHVPGLIGDVIDFNCSQSFRVQPELALAGAICLQSVLSGRKVRDQFGNRTNLYVVGIARSGAGKDYARSLNSRIIEATGYPELEGEGRFGSDSAVITSLTRQPVMLCQPDEFGLYLQAMTGAGNRSPWLAQIVSALLEVYTTAGGTYRSKSFADARKNSSVNQPCLTIHGVTVPGAMFSALKSENFSGGLVGRLLMFQGRDDPVRQRVPQQKIPEHIIEQSREWAEYKPHGGNLSNENPQPVVVPFSSEVEAMCQEWDDIAYEKSMTTDEPYSALWARAVENACKLALVYACSRSLREREVDADAFRWATGLIDHLTTRTIYNATQWVSEGMFDESQQWVLRVLRESKSNGLTQTELVRKTRKLRPRERAEILTNLAESGYAWSKRQDGKTKPTTIWYAS